MRALPARLRSHGVFLALFVAGQPSMLAAETLPAVPYPEGYRAWRVIKVRIVGPDSSQFATRGGIHLFFANDKAVEGFRAGRFPDGAVIVEEIVRPKNGEGAFKNTQSDGERVSIDVKVKDSAAFQQSGGWGYDTFKSDEKTSALSQSVRSNCASCHASQKDRDFTFSEMRQ